VSKKVGMSAELGSASVLMLVPPPSSPAGGPATDWGELVQGHDDRAIFQGRIDELSAIDIHSL
jgi:hypothetical protein